ncbi:MAG TPA: hypothetical protein VL614_16580 [Acetobacteraceae bacterium]|jgi:hypothetical protein|nr:hypothetical protein [Acetobacteraceae bacterium]
MDHAGCEAPADASPEPPQDQCASTVPHNITVILHAARILLDYGRHLIDTVRQRATAPNFEAIAACFGTGNLSTILAHLNRGILRAVALERVLLARAATGQDIDFVERRIHTTKALPTPAAAPDPLPIRKRASRPTGWDDPELFMPTLEDLERQVRRRPIGRTIHDICLDLAVVPGFCHSAFWNELFDIMTWFGGRVDRLMHQKARRREAFANEQDRKPDANWNWLNMSRDALRQVLGFFIGEPPVNPLEPAAAIATGPP